MKSRIVIFLLAVCLLVLAGCGTTEPQEEMLSFTDSCGRVVEIPANITSVAPSGQVTSMILTTIAPEYLAGVSQTPSSTQYKYLPESLLTLPTFGQMYGTKSSVNLEALVAAAPQVIIDMGDKRDDTGKNLDKLQKKTDIPVIFIEADLQHLPDAYRTLGSILSGKTERAAELADFAERTLNMAQENSSNITAAERRSVAYTSGTTGLNGNAAGSQQAQVIDLIGADNAIVVDTISNRAGGSVINMEQMFVFDPDVLVMSPGGPYEKMAADTLWQQLRAVQEGNYYEIPASPYNWLAEPPSVNMLLGIWWLGNLVYPKIYDYNMTEIAQEYYNLFWNYELSDSEAAEMLQRSQGKVVS